MRLKSGFALVAVAVFLALAFPATPSLADGFLVPPARDYEGSLEERSQEGVIIFQGSHIPGEAVEHLILKVSVDAAPARFGWVIPFPAPPDSFREDPALFRELFDYVEARRRQLARAKKGKFKGGDSMSADEELGVRVISRKTVGSYDVAVVAEEEPGMLNTWLETNDFRPISNGDDVVSFYREKGYVFACVKVSDVALADERTVDLHPIRFTFKTGGRDGIYFPMKMTGLQKEPFDLNLYVFTKAWINDRLNRYGYVHRGLRLHYRDWDSPRCKPNAGKVWSTPGQDPFLKSLADKLPTVSSRFRKLAPGSRFYLTNLQAFSMSPAEVRGWVDDLWLFPYYVNRSFVPYDARAGGPAAWAWPSDGDVPSSGADVPIFGKSSGAVSLPILALLFLLVLLMLAFFLIAVRRQMQRGR